MNTATVFLGNRLRDEDYHDDAARDRVLEEAIQAIQSQVDGLRILNRNRLFCSMTIAGTSKSIATLEALLARSGLGHIEGGAERQAIRAAGRK